MTAPLALALIVGWISTLAAGVAALALRRPRRRAPAGTFDEHAATAAALLQPDAPLFTDAETPFADEVQAWLRSRTPTIRPAFPEES